MTAPEPPPPEGASQPKSFSVIVTIVLVIMGIVLLLPGLCSLAFMVATGGRGSLVVADASPTLAGQLDVWGPSPALDVMRRVKAQFDPNNTLNPGRFVGRI